MKEVTICILDENENYLQLVQRYLLKRQLNNFKVLVFTDIKKVIDTNEDNNFRLCLINESFLKEDLSRIKADKIWILQEKQHLNCDYPIISKYQSMDKILEKMIEGIPDDLSFDANKNKIKLLTFFETQKTKNCFMGYTVSKYISSLGNKVLYLNLSPFTNFNFITNQEGADVTDLIYYLLKDATNLSKKIEVIKKEKDGVDFFLPAFDYGDLLELSKEEWLLIIDRLRGLQDYEYVVLETNGANRGFMEIYDNSVRFYINEEDEGKGSLELLLQKKAKNGLGSLSCYNKSDLDYWKGKLIEDGIR